MKAGDAEHSWEETSLAVGVGIDCQNTGIELLARCIRCVEAVEAQGRGGAAAAGGGALPFLAAQAERARRHVRTH